MPLRMPNRPAAAAVLAALFAVVLALAAPSSAGAQGGPAAGAPAAFVPGIRDLPLMPGLAPLGGEAVGFDKPEGRIAEAAAEGRIDPARVRDFYRETLPRLGWTPRGEDEFVRAGEALRLEFARAPGPAGRAPTVVRFLLRPAGG
jgi:hypothetical protein